MKTTKVSVFQLLQWKHAIRLEAKGIKWCSRSVKAHAARAFGLPVRCPREHVQREIDSALNYATEYKMQLHEILTLELGDS